MCLKEGRKCIKKSNWNGHGGVSMCACLRPIVQITQAVDRILIIVQWRLKSINMCNFREAAETEFSFKQNGPTKISYNGGVKKQISSRVDFNFWGMYSFQPLVHFLAHCVYIDVAAPVFELFHLFLYILTPAGWFVRTRKLCLLWPLLLSDAGYVSCDVSSLMQELGMFTHNWNQNNHNWYLKKFK